MAAGLSILDVDGLRITVERKAIRNLYLRVQSDGVIRLSVPRSISDEQLLRFVRSKGPWLAGQLTALGGYAPCFVTGERFPVWGATATLAVAPIAGKPRAALANGVLHLHLPAEAEEAQAKAALTSFYRSQLASALPAVAAERQAVMGLYARRWQLRDMTSRWGSCTPRTGDIRLNIQLAKFPQECLRYLVTHELAHLAEAGHGPRFYALLDQYDPAWREARQRLKAGAPALAPIVSV